VPIPKSPVLVVEDDFFLRMVGIVLDPQTGAERTAAFTDFFAHEEPDFAGYCRRVRERVPGLFPAAVRLVDTPADLRAALSGAHALIVEALPVAAAELAAAPDLIAVQKYGVGLRNIDSGACEERGIKVLTLRRRANIACAEHTMALMLALARKLNSLMGRVTLDRLAETGYRFKPFDRRHTPNSNWARIPGVRMLNQATLGLFGLGEIGREIALRAGAFDMRIVYHQRNRLPEPEERRLQACYVPLDRLLAQSDWIVPQLPPGPATRHLIGRDELARMKPGACLVNVAWPEIVERAALIEALQSGRLGGFALDPQYEVPVRPDDELLRFDNVVLTPHIAAQPRFNALNDIEDLVVGLAKALA
jgi:glyoxylate reductase/D-3-phosphoglycerate dehydrogenase